MPRSGEQAGHRGPREASSEAGTRLRGRGPRSRWDTLRGRHALERGGEFRGAVPAPRARHRFARGVPGMAVWWATEDFWAVGFICLRSVAGAGRD
jgi:hypothetical protein